MFEKLKELYVKMKYGVCRKPVYVKLFNCYYLGARDAEGKFYYEFGDLDYICSEYARNSVTYHYTARGLLQHEHRFAEVLYAAIKYEGKFDIPDEYINDYSEQELSMLTDIKKRVKRAPK